MADDLELKALRGYQGVATKLITQAEEILESTFLLTEDYERLFICDLSLVDTKWETLNDYDQQILTVSNVTDIQAKIEDSQQAIEKAMACKRKIGLKLKEKSSGSGENHNESYSNTGKVPARTSQAKAKLPKLTLPKFRGEFINGALSGTVFYPQFMTTQKFLKWTK